MMTRIHRPLLSLALLLAVSFCATACADDLLNGAPWGGSSKGAAAPADEPGLAIKRTEVTEQLRVAQRVLDTAKSAPANGQKHALEGLSQEVDLLKQVEMAIAQQESLQTRVEELSNRKVELAVELESVESAGLAEKRPYSFLLLDHLRDELLAQQDRQAAVEDSVRLAGEAVAQARANLERCETAYRRAKEAAEANKNEAKLATELKLADLQQRLARETLSLRKREEGIEVLLQEIHQVQLKLLEEKISCVSKEAPFSDRDLSDQLVEIEKQEFDLKGKLEEAEDNLEFAKDQWFSARQKLDVKTETDQTLVEEVEAWRLLRDTYQQQVTMLNARLARLTEMRETWARRFKVINNQATSEELSAWRDFAADRLEQLAREQEIRKLRIDEIRSKFPGLEKKLETTNGGNEQLAYWIKQQQSALQKLIQVYGADVVNTESSLRLLGKHVQEIDGDVSQWSLGNWVTTAWRRANNVWSYEVMAVDDKSITVGKIFVGVILLVAGFYFSRRGSRAIGQRLLRRLGMHDSAVAALQSLSFYCLLVVCTLFALKFVNVPLTIFTFLGGALAIGLGFGSQNLVNNFISGLILLAERPIRVGDLIQLDTLYGTVEHIGTRSTRIRTANNHEIIVPNRSFLDNNVLNLTLGDSRVRTSVGVGVAYGSPTRDVARLLKRAAEEHGLVLHSPEPFVWFTDFGDNALVFELHFWVEVRNITERKRIESDLRFMVDQSFRDAGIVIAFPQRDLHVDVQRPFEVRLLSPETHEDEMSEAPSKEAA